MPRRSINTVFAEEVIRSEAFFYEMCETLENDTVFHSMQGSAAPETHKYLLRIRREVKQMLDEKVDSEEVTEQYYANLRFRRAVPMVDLEYMFSDSVALCLERISRHHYRMYAQILEVMQSIMWYGFSKNHHFGIFNTKKRDTFPHLINEDSSIHTAFVDLGIKRMLSVYSGANKNLFVLTGQHCSSGENNTFKVVHTKEHTKSHVVWKNGVLQSDPRSKRIRDPKNSFDCAKSSRNKKNILHARWMEVTWLYLKELKNASSDTCKEAPCDREFDMTSLFLSGVRTDVQEGKKKGFGAPESMDVDDVEEKKELERPQAVDSTRESDGSPLKKKRRIDVQIDQESSDANELQLLEMYDADGPENMEEDEEQDTSEPSRPKRARSPAAQVCVVGHEYKHRVIMNAGTSGSTEIEETEDGSSTEYRR